MVTRSSVLIALLIVAISSCTALTSRDERGLTRSNFDGGCNPDPGPMTDAGPTPDGDAPDAGSDGGGSDGGSGGQCAVFEEPVESEGGTPIPSSDQCVTAACEPDASCEIVEADGGVMANADPEIVGSLVVVTKQGAPADVSVTIVDKAKGKNVASKKVEKNATDVMIRTDLDITTLDMAAIDGVGKKGYKIKIVKAGILVLPGKKVKHYVEIEITGDVDPNIIVP